MILSQKELRQAVERGEIQFDPPLRRGTMGRGLSRSASGVQSY